MVVLGGPSRLLELKRERARERENKLNIYLKIKAIILKMGNFSNKI